MTEQGRAKREMEEIAVLQVWNCGAYDKDNGTGIKDFKRHLSLLPDATTAIRSVIKEGWTYEAIKGAIVNYLYILAYDNKFFFNWKWTLAEFLTRGKKDDKGKRWLWFYSEYFDEKRWYIGQEKQVSKKSIDQLSFERIERDRAFNG